jgi:hypothetical protein
MGQILQSYWLWAVIIGCNFTRSANKSNHLTKNPLLFITEPRIRDNMADIYRVMISSCQKCENTTSVNNNTHTEYWNYLDSNLWSYELIGYGKWARYIIMIVSTAITRPNNQSIFQRAGWCTETWPWYHPASLWISEVVHTTTSKQTLIRTWSLPHIFQFFMFPTTKRCVIEALIRRKTPQKIVRTNSRGTKFCWTSPATSDLLRWSGNSIEKGRKRSRGSPQCGPGAQITLPPKRQQTNKHFDWLRAAFLLFIQIIPLAALNSEET